MTHRDAPSWFTLREFLCPCGRCTPTPPSQDLVRRLDELRSRYGKPIRINSGVRCAEHNREVGGVPESEHVTGEGADIRCETSQERRALLKLATPLFDRIGIDRRFLHLGVSTSLPQVYWLY